MNMIFALLTIIACCNAELLTPVDHASHIRFPPPHFPRSDGYPTGHKESLGSQRPPEGQIHEYFVSPTPKELWDTSVKPYKPSVIRGALRDSPALTKWTDEYLLKEYGEEEATVESSVEDRTKETKRMSLKGFIDVYKKIKWYIVSVLPDSMRKDIRTPTPLMCSSFVDELLEEDLWMGAGGTMSVVHHDALNIIHCLVTGRKDWILIHPKYKSKLDLVTSLRDSNSGFSHLPVTSIDYDIHPEVWDVPWHYVTLRPGDCLYLPSKYLHQVRSYNRSISATFLVHPRERISYKDCEGMDFGSYKNHSELFVPWTYEKGQETIDMGYTHPKNNKADALGMMKVLGLTWMTPRIFAYFTDSMFGEMESGRLTLFRDLDKDNDHNITLKEIENSDISVWKEFTRASNRNGHGPTKTMQKENIKFTKDSIEFVPNPLFQNFDVENAKTFLNFVIRVKGANHAISQPEFEKWIVTTHESVSSLFKKLDFNSDGFLTTRDLNKIHYKKLRDFSRAYYQLKGTRISSGGIHIEEVMDTDLGYLENMNEITDELLVTEEEKEETKEPEEDNDFLTGFLREMKKYVESTPNKQVGRQQFLDEMPRSEWLLDSLNVSSIDYKILFHLLDRGQKGYIVLDDVEVYVKNEYFLATEPLREFEDDNPEYIRLNPDLPLPKDLLGLLIQGMDKFQAKYQRVKQNVANKESRQEL